MVSRRIRAVVRAAALARRGARSNRSGRGRRSVLLASADFRARAGVSARVQHLVRVLRCERTRVAAGAPASVHDAGRRRHQSVSRAVRKNVKNVMPIWVPLVGLVGWLAFGDWLAGAALVVLALCWVLLPAEEGPPVLALAATMQWTSVCIGF